MIIVHYSREDNTWEPQENLGCPELIAAFESDWEEKQGAKKRPTSVTGAKKRALVEDKEDNKGKDKKKAKTAVRVSQSCSKNTKDCPLTLLRPNPACFIPFQESSRAELTGFDRGLDPEKIIGATDSSGELMFLMKWKETDEADLVPARQANVKCPQVVIGFYEERLTWHTSGGDE